MVTYADLFAFVIMIIALLTYIDRRNSKQRTDKSVLIKITAPVLDRTRQLLYQLRSTTLWAVVSFLNYNIAYFILQSIILCLIMNCETGN